jgi:mRNA-degrading endonuclease toxin of MazEF toxin-antitoxin module
MRRGEVWWAEPESLNGSEIQKTRLVVIISNDSSKGNLFRAAVAPITSGIERIYPGEALIRILGKKEKLWLIKSRLLARNSCVQKLAHYLKQTFW